MAAEQKRRGQHGQPAARRRSESLKSVLQRVANGVVTEPHQLSPQPPSTIDVPIFEGLETQSFHIPPSDNVISPDPFQFQSYNFGGSNDFSPTNMVASLEQEASDALFAGFDVSANPASSWDSILFGITEGEWNLQPNLT